MWDIFASKPGNIQDGSNPSVATDFYNKYKEDIALMKAMGVKNFRSAAAAAALGAGALLAFSSSRWPSRQPWHRQQQQGIGRHTSKRICTSLHHAGSCIRASSTSRCSW